MVGTASNLLGNVVSGPFTIHGYFTGSIQGTKSVEQLTPLLFVDVNTNAITNTATIAFSDTASAVSPYPATGSFSEEKVCVQPFVYVKSAPTDNGLAGGNPTGAVTNINNISWEQAKYLLSAGNAPLAFWTGKSSDSNLVYFVNRTKDSGTRMSYLREEGYTYNQGVTTYIFSFTNGFWYKAANNNTTQGVVGESNAVFQVGIVSSGAEILNAANLGWGPGYVGGGDIKTEMGYHTNANQAVVLPLHCRCQEHSGWCRKQLVASHFLWWSMADGGWCRYSWPDRHQRLFAHHLGQLSRSGIMKC